MQLLPGSVVIFFACVLGIVAAAPTESGIDALRMTAEAGDPKAQYELGLLYASGAGLTKSSDEAVKWVRKSAAQGNAAAQAYLGVMFANGEGVVKDPAEAVKCIARRPNKAIPTPNATSASAIPSARASPRIRRKP